MKHQILERLHTLATDLEDVGLGKYAEKVNDVFEKIADSSDDAEVKIAEPTEEN